MSTDVERIEKMTVPKSISEAYAFSLPQSYTYGDYIWPGLLLTAERLEELADFDFYPTDILICSYPKSGTTWISEIVSLIVNKGDTAVVKRSPLNQRVPWLEMDTRMGIVKMFSWWQTLTRWLGVDLFSTVSEPAPEARNVDETPRVFFTHVPLELLPRAALDLNIRLIYVARNPKDQAVSFYHFHQMARFLGCQRLPWNDFFQLYTTGQLYSGPWHEHVQSFWQYAKRNDNVLYLKYEDMKMDLKSAVQKTAKHLNGDLSDEVIARIVEHCTFDEMKTNKMANRQGVWAFDQSISKFMRKGEIGDWENYFTLSQNKLFDQVYQARMLKTPDLRFAFSDDEARQQWEGNALEAPSTPESMTGEYEK